MKTKLLRKLRKQVVVKYSKQTGIRDRNTDEIITAKFCVYDPIKNLHVYYDTKDRAIQARREVILKLVQQKREFNYKNFRVLTPKGY